MTNENIEPYKNDMQSFIDEADQAIAGLLIVANDMPGIKQSIIKTDINNAVVAIGMLQKNIKLL